MKKINLLLAALIACCITAHAQQTATFKANHRVIETKQFNKQVNDMLTDIGIPGLSLAIINNDQVVFSNVYGSKTQLAGDQADPETIFEACSLSKSFLVFVAMQLADQQKLDLDKPLYEYLEYPLLQHDSRYKLITARMILSHSSGIENYKRENNAEVLELVAAPGTDFVYSSAGYVYLGNVIEVILKKSADTYLKELVYEPLQLHRTFSKYEKDGSYPQNYATGYTVFGKKIKKWKNDSVLVSGGIHTTAKDYATLITSIFNRKYLSDDRVKDITQGDIGLGDKGKLLYWGAGFGLQYAQGDTIIFQNGVQDGFRSWVYYSKKNKSGVAFFTNSSLGMSILKKLNELSVNLNIDPLLDDSDFEHYPDPALALLRIYRTGPVDNLFNKVAHTSNKELSFASLNNLALIIASDNKTVAKRLMEENRKRHPEKSEAYLELGKLDFRLKDYKSALANFTQCKLLNPGTTEVEGQIKECLKRLN